MIKIRDGFPGQRLVVLPFYKIEEALQNPLTSDLVVHSMGYFPHAEHHYINRPSGADEYILIYCVKGEGWFVLNDKKYKVESNQFFILPPNEPHQYGASENMPWDIYWFHFKGKKAKEVLRIVEGVQTITVADNSRIVDRTALMDEMLNLLEGHMDMSTLNYVNMALYGLLASFLYVDAYREAKKPKGQSENISFVTKVLHFMNENVEKRLTVHDMASYVGLSESQFYRLFYEQTKYAPMAYFMHIKAKHACDLLENTRLRVHQVAMKLGFDDPYYFSRYFKKIIGMSPVEYRKVNLR